MVSLFSSPKFPAIPAAPAAPSPTDPAARAAAQELALNQAGAAGRASTVLTGGQGDTAPPPVARKTLLGA